VKNLRTSSPNSSGCRAPRSSARSSPSLSEDEFSDIYGRIQARGLQHWADPGGTRPGEINRNDGGRGVYFCDPGGHYLEIITRPYGSGAD
jgi:hypothetical protein